MYNLRNKLPAAKGQWTSCLASPNRDTYNLWRQKKIAPLIVDSLSIPNNKSYELNTKRVSKVLDIPVEEVYYFNKLAREAMEIYADSIDNYPIEQLISERNNFDDKPYKKLLYPPSHKKAAGLVNFSSLNFPSNPCVVGAMCPGPGAINEEVALSLILQVIECTHFLHKLPSIRRNQVSDAFKFIESSVASGEQDKSTKNEPEFRLIITPRLGLTKVSNADLATYKQNADTLIRLANAGIKYAHEELGLFGKVTFDEQIINDTISLSHMLSGPQLIKYYRSIEEEEDYKLITSIAAFLKIIYYSLQDHNGAKTHEEAGERNYGWMPLFYTLAHYPIFDFKNSQAQIAIGGRNECAFAVAREFLVNAIDLSSSTRVVAELKNAIDSPGGGFITFGLDTTGYNIPSGSEDDTSVKKPLEFLTDKDKKAISRMTELYTASQQETPYGALPEWELRAIRTAIMDDLRSNAKTLNMVLEATKRLMGIYLSQYKRNGNAKDKNEE